MTLHCEDLACIRSGQRLFSEINFQLRPGDALRVAGGNGSGKTTLLRALTGLGRVDAGTVRWQGIDVRTASQAYREQLLYIGHAPGVKPELAAWENIAHAEALGGTAGEAAARAALAAAGLTRQADMPVRLLSQGQRRRVALARLHLPRPRRVWILDEPFAGLDAAASGALETALRRHCADGGIVVCTTHQPLDLPGCATLHLGDAETC